MENPFKPDDKVLTKIKGAEVEVTVRLIWNNEVQVKCADGSLRWRTAKTVWFPHPAVGPTPTTELPITEPQPSEPSPSAPLPTSSDAPAPTKEPAPSAGEQAASGLVEPAVAPAVTACGGEAASAAKKAKCKKRK